MSGRALADLQTPALILDRNKLRSNINRMSARASELGVPLRPHLKTPKCIQVAAMLQDAGAAGFCVSTLMEAEYFHAAGISDLYYCVPFAPDKAARAAALKAAGCDLTLMIDSREAAEAAITALRAAGGSAVLDVTIEIDVDGYRSGLSLDNDELIATASILAVSGVTRFAGIASYAGASYGKTIEATRELTEVHRKALIATRTALSEAGLPCDIVSLGSTPAVLHASHLDGVTEARCGIYTFQDLFQAGIGACSIEDIAVSVLTSVISRQPRHNRFVIDAGGLALSKDRSTAGRPFDADYGIVCEYDSGKPIDDLVVTAVSQELGLVSSKSGAPIDFRRFRIGDRVRVLPNHADMTAAAYPGYDVVDNKGRVEDWWGRINGWSEVPARQSGGSLQRS